MEALLTWMDTSALHNWVVGSGWVWPALETLHFLGLCLLLGGLLLVDLRIVGYNKTAPIEPIHAFIPIVIAGFAINVITGLLFLFGDPFRYAPNVAFQFKMFLVFLAGLNVAYFELIVHPKIKRDGEAAEIGLDAKLVAGASLVFWIGVIMAGRLIPYFEY